MTEPNKRERVLAKIRKLMAMGRDARGNMHETESALRQAAKMMEEAGISEAEVDMQALDDGSMEFGEADVRPDGKSPSEASQAGKAAMKECPTWANVLSWGVSKFTDTLVRMKRGPLGMTLVFQGERNDVLLARWLFGVLIDSINRELRAGNFTGRSEAGDFRRGAAGSLQRRMKELAAERRKAFQQAASSGSRALVVVDRKAREIEERFGSVRSTNFGLRISRASEAGKRAGDRINIPSGRPVGGSAPNQRIGG